MRPLGLFVLVCIASSVALLPGQGVLAADVKGGCSKSGCSVSKEVAWWERIDELADQTSTFTPIGRSKVPVVRHATGAATEPRRMIVPSDVLFEVDSASINLRGQQMIVVMIPKLRSALSIVVAGATDGSGTASYNIALSKRRAEAVVSLLRANGLAGNQISSVGYGSNHPVADENGRDPLEARARNRRVEITAEFRG
jgi:outer membrane protein OmpA-like peptidoglycan-associated protein